MSSEDSIRSLPYAFHSSLLLFQIEDLEIQFLRQVESLQQELYAQVVKEREKCEKNVREASLYLVQKMEDDRWCMSSPHAQLPATSVQVCAYVQIHP